MPKKKSSPRLIDNLHTLVHGRAFHPLRMTVMTLIGVQMVVIAAVSLWAVTDILFVRAITLTDDSEGAFDAGTYGDTEFANGGVELDSTGKTNGTGTFSSEIKDVGIDSAWDTLSWSEDVGPNGEFRMEIGSTTGTSSFATVNLQQSYVSPIVIPFFSESSNSIPVEVRLGNVTSSSFDLKLMNPSGTAPSNDTVYYMVVEEGAFTLPDGTLIESGSFSTTNVGSKANGWTSGVTVNFTQSFSGAPAVFHHAQSSNDTQWISTWISRQGSNTNPPDTNGFEGSLNGLEAFNSITNAEDFGWVAIETGTGTIEDTDFEVQITGDSVTGHDNGCGTFSYSNSYSSNPLVIGDNLEVDGGDGGWLVACSESTTQIGLHDEEDQVGDSERSHTSETVAFAAFEEAFSYRSIDATFQVRSCDDAACSGETFVGPDGTAGTVFTTPGGESINVTDNRYFQYRMTLTTESASYTSNVDSVSIDYTPSNAPPTVSIDSAAERTDATGAVDISVEVDDAEDEDTILKVEYETDSDGACNGPWANADLNETSGATATFNDSGGAPSVDDGDTYQVGSDANQMIITSSGVNTVSFVWNSATDLASASGTQCLRFTANDGTTDTSPATTHALTVDNVDPSFSSVSVSPSSGSVTNGDIVTVTIDAGETGLTSSSCDINGSSSSGNFTDNGDNTYDILYVPITGHPSWSAGNLSISCTLQDAYGNNATASSFTDGNTLSGSIESASGGESASCPSIGNTFFSINDGDESTHKRDVELEFRADNATLVIYSENNLFNDASFGPIISPVDFELSEGEELKRIYAQFKSDCATSNVFSDSITYEIPAEGSIEAQKIAEEEAAEAAEQGTEDTTDEGVEEDDSEESTEEVIDEADPNQESDTTVEEKFTPPADGINEEVGGFVVVEAIVDDENPEAAEFTTTLSITDDDFYNGAILSFFTGELSGESRTILDYIGESRTIVLSEGFEFAPEDGDRFSIVKQDIIVEVPSTTEIIERLQEEGFSVEEIGFTEEEEDDIFAKIRAVDEGVEDVYLDVVVNELPVATSELAKNAVRDSLQAESDRLMNILSDVELANINSSTLDRLLGIHEEDVSDLFAIQSKTATLQAVNDLAERILETNGRTPIVESYMNWGSVKMNFLAANPLPIPLEVSFQTYLPREASSEHFLSLDGLQVSYDAAAGSFVVSESVTLDPNEVLVRSVEMQDVWVVEEEVLTRFAAQSATLLSALEQSSFFVQGVIIDGSINTGIDLVSAEQERVANSPQQHILAFRKNQKRLVVIEEDLAFFQSLVEITAELRLEEARTRNTRLSIALVLSGTVLVLLVAALVWRYRKNKNGQNKGARPLKKSVKKKLKPQSIPPSENGLPNA